MDLHLYPTALRRDHAVREATRSQGTLFDHRRVTYPELCERLYRAEGLPGRLIELPVQTVFIRHSLTAAMDEDPSPGLVTAYRGLIDELKGAGLAAEDAARAFELSAAELPSNTRRSIQRLVEVFQRYQRCLDQAGLVDQGDRDLAVLTHLQRLRASGTKPAWLQSIRRIVAHDMYHLSLVHYAIVSLLIQLVDDGGVLQHFSAGTNVDAMRFAEFTWQRFVADESLAALVLPEFAKPRQRGGNLEALSERLFTADPAEEPLEPDGTLTVIAAPGRAREVETLMRRVRELLEDGVSPERIAIIVRHLELYGDLLDATARRYRVPLWFRRGLPLFHVPLTKTVFSLLELADSPYPRQALLKVLTSAYLRSDDEWPDDVVGLVNAAGYLDRTHAPLPKLLQGYIQRRQLGADEAVKVNALATWVEQLQMSLDGFLERPRPFLAHLEALKALLLQLGVMRAMGMTPDVPLHVVQRDREALRLLFDTLWAGAEALRLLGDAPLDFATFRLLAIDLLREVTLDQALPAAGAVPVLGVRDVLGLDFDYVFVPGLADTEFPQHYSDHPVLDDAARQALNPAARALLSEKFAGVLDRRLLGRVLLTTMDRAREEPLLFFLALEAANHKCILSYPTRTPDGEAIFASIFVDEVRRHFREVETTSTVVQRLPALPSVPPLSQCMEPGEALRQFARAWWVFGVNSPTGPSALDEVWRAHDIDIERLRQLARIEHMRKRYLLEANPLDDIDAAAFGHLARHFDLRPRLLDAQRPWSPSMLEDLAACPFAFFAAHVLRLSPRSEPDYDISPPVLGTLAHAILARYFQTEPPRNPSTAVRQMRTIAHQVLTSWDYGPGFGHPGFWQVRKTELLAILEDLATYLATHPSDGYRTYYHERTMTGVAPCGAWSVYLTGRVDRVAVREGPTGITGVLVQDFKYSASAARYHGQLQADALGYWSFQLPVYLYLTLQQLANDGHHLSPDAELRLEYLLLKDAGKKALDTMILRDFFDPDQAWNLFQGVRQLTERALAGHFAPRPMDPKQTCAHCAYTALCRFWSSGAGAETWRLRGTVGAGEADAEDGA